MIETLKKTSKESPILFSTPMVQAILEGRKTQTRRVIKQIDRLAKDVQNTDLLKLGDISGFCPFGQKGDVLWVRETWAKFNGIEENEPFIYKADACWNQEGVEGLVHLVGGQWKPSIHMPREACRLRLEITDIRVERLQDISEEDAIAEGCKIRPDGFPEYEAATKGMIGWDCAKEWFQDVWQNINGSESWQANPWVWVVEFKKL